MPARHVEDHKWWTLTAVCVATFMLLMDITIVNVALPDIAKALHSSFTDLQWVIDAYALSLAALLLTWGATSDRVGRRYIFVVGLGIFTVASLGCALSTSPLMLNLARAVQGVGGAAMFATSLALLASAFHGPRARDGGRDLGRDDRRGRRHRPAGRRRADREHRLGVDLLHQRPDRDRGDLHLAHEGGRVQGPERRSERLARAHHASRAASSCSSSRSCAATPRAGAAR